VKKLAFLTQNKGKLCKILILTLVFETNANFFAENCRKSPKIVIITSTPEANPMIGNYNASTVKIYGEPTYVTRFENKKGTLLCKML
jgi:purine nucleoside permease